MLDKFKGLNVPRPDPNSKKDYNDLEDIRRKFCYKSRMDDCDQITCSECMFNIEPTVYPDYDTSIFDEWYKMKGKVQYDAS